MSSVVADKRVLSPRACPSLRARFESKVWHFPLLVLLCFRKVCLLEADEVKYWGLSDGGFVTRCCTQVCSGSSPCRARAPQFANLSLCKMTTLCHHWVHSQHQTGGVRTRWQTGSSQQTRLLFRETSALRACQWALKTTPGKPSPVLGSPEMQPMQWGDTREDHQDDQVAEAPDVWGQSWVLRALRGESYNYLTESRRRARLSTEEHSNRTGCDEDKLEWERCLKPSSKPLLSPGLDKTPSEVPQQPVLCCWTKPNGNQMAAT